MGKVVALGEILLRLSPPNYQTFQQAKSFDSEFGGSELNVLACLAQLGHQVELISALPDNEMGKMALRSLLANQIGISSLLKRSGRLGLYYYQKGYSMRPSRIIYDRTASVFSQIKLEDVDVDAVLEDAVCFHVSGITIALSESIAELAFHLMKRSKELGILVSFDLNYRDSLWNSFQEARDVFARFIELADICFGLEPIQLKDSAGADLKDIWNLQRPYQDKDLLLRVLARVQDTYGLKSLVFTQRQQSFMNSYQLQGFLYEGGQLYSSEKRDVMVLDRVGTGDAFTAGILHGYLEGVGASDVLEIGLASFVWKHTIEGDVSQFGSQELQAMLEQDSFEIKR